MMPQASHNSGGSKAPLREVYVSEQVLHSCFRHAFTTEKEEVMGMLLGRLERRRFPPVSGCAASGQADGLQAAGSAGSVAPTSTSASSSSSPSPSLATVEGKVAFIWATHVSERSVQCSDRVEMSPESLASASETAELVSAATGASTTVVGWYHSHPKIPVVPSAVDLRTQKEHQQHFESGWVGLIVSLFNTEVNINRSHCALHCFQAGPCNEYVPIPVHVVSQAELFSSPVPLQALPDTTADLLRVLQREIQNGVHAVEDRTSRDAAATRAARGLADAQLYEVDGLVAEPTRRALQLCSLPALRAEVARLEKELAGRHPSR